MGKIIQYDKDRFGQCIEDFRTAYTHFHGAGTVGGVLFAVGHGSELNNSDARHEISLVYSDIESYSRYFLDCVNRFAATKRTLDNYDVDQTISDTDMNTINGVRTPQDINFQDCPGFSNLKAVYVNGKLWGYKTTKAYIEEGDRAKELATNPASTLTYFFREATVYGYYQTFWAVNRVMPVALSDALAGNYCGNSFTQEKIVTIKDSNPNLD